MDALKDAIGRAPEFIPSLVERAPAAGADRERLTGLVATGDEAIAKNKPKAPRLVHLYAEGELDDKKTVLESVRCSRARCPAVSWSVPPTQSFSI